MKIQLNFSFLILLLKICVDFDELIIRSLLSLRCLFLNAGISIWLGGVHNRFYPHQVFLSSSMGFQIEKIVVRVVFYGCFEQLQKFYCRSLAQRCTRPHFHYPTFYLVDLHFLYLAPVPQLFIVVLVHLVYQSESRRKPVQKKITLPRNQTKYPRLFVLYHFEDYRESLRVLRVLP